jgi:hypothetical protein
MAVFSCISRHQNIGKVDRPDADPNSGLLIDRVGTRPMAERLDTTGEAPPRGGSKIAFAAPEKLWESLAPAGLTLTIATYQRFS